MPRNTVVLHTGLVPDAVADALLQSVETEAVPQWAVPWFIAPWVTRPAWSGASRQVIRDVHGKTFRLERRDGGRFSSTFYGSWQAEHGGTKIEGYFGLSPLVGKSLRYSLVIMVILTVLGVMLNLLDLTVGTHFTKDPDVGLTLSIFVMLLSFGGYLLAQWLGSRRDVSLLASLEQKLSAFVENPMMTGR